MNFHLGIFSIHRNGDFLAYSLEKVAKIQEQTTYEFPKTCLQEI